MSEITATLASIPSRVESLGDTIESLLPQVDRVKVYLNGYDVVPLFMVNYDLIQPYISRGAAGDLGDAGKFFSGAHEPTGYQLHCDDDLIYPHDYAERMIEGVERYNRRRVVSLHGRRVRGSHIPSYYNGGCTVWHCMGDVEKDQKVHILGTGVMAYHSDLIRFTQKDFPKLPKGSRVYAQPSNMADIWVGLRLQREKIGAVCLAHRRGWLVHSTKVDLGKTIYSRSKGNDAFQTSAVNANGRWNLYA